MQTVVTGGSGFVGSFLVDRLIELGHDVVLFDRKESQYVDSEKIKFIKGDITSKEDVGEALLGADVVFHLAGLLGTNELIDYAYEATIVNIGGSLRVMEACIEYDVKLINISKPNCWLNPYTITKNATEKYIEMFRKEKGLQASTVKWFNVYGGRQPLLEEIGYRKAVPTWILNALNNHEIQIYGDGEQTMDLIYVDDSVNAVLAILNSWESCEGKVFEVGSGVEISANNLAYRLKEICNSESDIRHVAMRPGETSHTRIKADLTNIKGLTSWRPTTDLTTGLQYTVDWYRDRYLGPSGL